MLILKKSLNRLRDLFKDEVRKAGLRVRTSGISCIPSAIPRTGTW